MSSYVSQNSGFQMPAGAPQYDDYQDNYQTKMQSDLKEETRSYGSYDYQQVPSYSRNKQTPSRFSKCSMVRCNKLFVTSTMAVASILQITILVTAILAVCRVCPGVRMGQILLGAAGGTTILAGLGQMADGVNESRYRPCLTKIVTPIGYGVSGLAVGALFSVFPYVFGGLAAGGVISGAAAGWVIIGVNAVAISCFTCVGSLMLGCLSIAILQQNGSSISEKWSNFKDS